VLRVHPLHQPHCRLPKRHPHPRAPLQDVLQGATHGGGSSAAGVHRPCISVCVRACVRAAHVRVTCSIACALRWMLPVMRADVCTRRICACAVHVLTLGVGCWHPGCNCTPAVSSLSWFCLLAKVPKMPPPDCRHQVLEGGHISRYSSKKKNGGRCGAQDQEPPTGQRDTDDQRIGQHSEAAAQPQCHTPATAGDSASPS
jgi:hypothetical protein